MAPPISDAVVVDVLRRVDRLLSPGVQRLGRPAALPQAEPGPLVGRAGLPAWPPASAAAPRFLGQLADLLPLQNTVGTAVQSLVVLGVAGEHGVGDPAERVSLLARVLLGRELSAERGAAAADPRQGHLPGGRARQRPATRDPCVPSGGPPGSSAASTTPSTSAPRAGCTTARWRTCRWSACSAATRPRRRDSAAPRGRTAAAPRRARQPIACGRGDEVGVHLTRSRRPVHGDEVDAGHALGQQRAAQLGRHLDARAPGRRPCPPAGRRRGPRSARRARSGTPDRTAGRSG